MGKEKLIAWKPSIWTPLGVIKLTVEQVKAMIKPVANKAS